MITARLDMALSRRAVLGGLAAVSVDSPRATAADDSAGAALDRALNEPDPGRALRLLHGIRGYTLRRRLDLEAAIEGLEADRRLAASPRDFVLGLQRRWGIVDPTIAGRRVQRIHDALSTRAARLLAGVGAPATKLGQGFKQLWRAHRYDYPTTDAGRDRAVAEMNRIARIAARDAVREFGPLPPAVARLRVHRMTAADEQQRRAGYRELPGPGREGGYFVDLADMERRPTWSLPSVVHHEVAPGHLLQSWYEERASPHPLRLRYAPHFGEGWAIHAESLAVHSDPRAALGQLHCLLFRTSRALVDIGLHLHGWSPAKARTLFEETLGEPAYFAPFEDDLARIAAEPSARTAEVLAWLDIAAGLRGLNPAGRQAYHRRLLVVGRLRKGALNRLVSGG